MTQRFIRKLGDPHAISIEVTLTEAQRAERRTAACGLRDQQAALAEEKKLAMAGFGQRKKLLENQEAIARGEAATGKAAVAVIVQDYLSHGNEVVSVGVDAEGNVLDVVARRTATAEELQEEMFGGSEDEDKPH